MDDRGGLTPTVITPKNHAERTLRLGRTDDLAAGAPIRPNRTSVPQGCRIQPSFVRYQFELSKFSAEDQTPLMPLAGSSIGAVQRASVRLHPQLARRMSRSAAPTKLSPFRSAGQSLQSSHGPQLAKRMSRSLAPTNPSPSRSPGVVGEQWSHFAMLKELTPPA